MSEMTSHEYWKEVSDLASGITQECFDEFPEDQQAEIREDNDNDAFREALYERLHETIDGHQWVIYTAYNFDILRHSPNNDYSVVNFGAEGVANEAGMNWGYLAYGALYADVQEHSSFGVVEETVKA